MPASVGPDDPGEFEPRLVEVSRRAFLRRSAVAGAIVAFPVLACSKSDAEVFAGSSSATVAPSEPAPTEPAAATNLEPAPTEPAPGDVEPTPTEPAVQSTGPTAAMFPTGAELAVVFAYVAGAGGRGRILNPYVAVWVEDHAGNLIDTIGLWFLQEQKGTRWLNDLRRWYSASNQASDTSMSGATRPAGAYSVVWDGTDLSGNPVEQGDYFLFIEAAREHGPYSITSTPITIGSQPFSVALSDNVEIADASAELIL